MGIVVANESSGAIEVAINQWGGDGDTSFFSVSTGGKPESWDRTDQRGFVMALKKQGSERPYYVQSNSSIVVTAESVKENGQTIYPLA